MKKDIRILMTIVITAFVMLFSTTAVSFAGVAGQSISEEDFQEELLENVLLPKDIVIEDQKEETIQPYATPGITLAASFKRKSGKGHASVKAIYAYAKSMKSTITLQVKGKNGYTNVKSATYSDTGITIGHRATFTVAAGKKYRIKITIKATGSKSTVTKVDYRNLVAE